MAEGGRNIFGSCWLADKPSVKWFIGTHAGQVYRINGGFAAKFGRAPWSILVSQPRGLNMEKKCESQCGEHRCQLPHGHKGKHRFEGCSWTDAGAARVNAELQRKAPQ